MSDLVTKNLPLLTCAPNGIQKLRELILGLAVTGKLVRSRAAPGTVERVGRERGFHRSELAIPLLKELSIPPSWEWFYVGDICDLRTGATPSTQKPDYYSGDIKWLVSGDINRSTIFDCEGRITEAALRETNCKILPVDSVLIALNGQGKTRATVAMLRVEAACNQSLVAMTPKDASFVSASFVYLNLKYRYREIREITGDKQRRGLNMGLVRDLLISVPPFDEQQAIVAKVDELMTLCDVLEREQGAAERAHIQLVEALLGSLTQALNSDDFALGWQRLSEHFHALFTTESSIDTLRQALLQLAVMGKLVPQDSSDEPASDLLAQIAQERSELSGKAALRQPKKNPEPIEEEMPFLLPSGWVWASVAELVLQITDGTHHTPTYLPAGVPFISVKDIDGKTINFSRCKYISKEQHQSINARCNPEIGDILLCRIGTLGRPTIVDTEQPFSLFVSVGLLKIPKSSSISRFLHLLLSSPLLYQQYDQIKAGGSHTSKLNLGDIPKLMVPLPPLAEQHRIVDKIDQLMALCDELKSRLAQARQRNEQLASTLVERAVA